MPYTPTTWVNDSTPLDATNMNHLETGLQAAAASAEQAPRADAITSITAWDVPVWNGSSWVRPSGTATAAKFLRGDGAWALPVSAATALPGSPVDGQEAILVDSTTAPTYQWRFRYNAGSSSSYKWEFVGGSAKIVEAAATDAISTTSAWVVPTNTPVFTAPRSGDYRIEWAFGANISVATATYSTIVLNASTTPGFAAPGAYMNASGDYSVSHFVPYTGIAAGDVIKLAHFLLSGTLTLGRGGTGLGFRGRLLSVTPMRVS